MILDKSGSMGMIRSQTISGFNEYIQTLIADKKTEYILSLTTFDTEVNKVYKSVKVDESVELNAKNYAPSGMTALYDATVSTIKEVAAKAKKKETYICVIITDGQENSSKEYKMKDMNEEIKKMEKEGWTFVFLGANQDSFNTGAAMGFSTQNVSNFNATDAGSKAMFRSVATNTVSFSAQSAGGFSPQGFFSKDDQDELNNTK